MSYTEGDNYRSKMISSQNEINSEISKVNIDFDSVLELIAIGIANRIKILNSVE